MSKLSVVMYHYVRDLKSSRFPEIKGLDFKLFVEQIEFLRRHYQFVTSEQLARCLDSREPLPDKAVLLSFDDAYIDHYTHVFPLLDRLGIQRNLMCLLRQSPKTRSWTSIRSTSPCQASSRHFL